MMIRAVLLDLDNTLYPYDPPDEAALGRVFLLLQRQFKASDRRLRTLYRLAHAHFAKALAGQAGRHNRLHLFTHMIESMHGRPLPDLALRVHQAYWQTFLSAARPHPDAHRVLRQLARRFRLALVSNQTTEVQLRKIKRLRFGRYFDALITSELAGVEKPDPAIFQLAMEKLGVRPQEAVMLGDTARGDVAGAHAAGIRAIQTVEYIHDRAAGIHPDAVIRSLPQILDILQKTCFC